MDSQLTRVINPNKYVTTIRRGFFGLGLGSCTGLLRSELVTTPTDGNMENFFIRRLFKTYSHIMTHAMYPSDQCGLHSRPYLNV